MAANPPLNWGHPYQLDNLDASYFNFCFEFHDLLGRDVIAPIENEILIGYKNARGNQIRSKMHPDEMVTHPRGRTATAANFELVLEMEEWVRGLPKGHAFIPRARKLLSYCESTF